MKHKILLLGLGFWGNFWLDNIQNNNKCELVGVAGDQAGIDIACEKYGFSNSITFDYKEAIDKTDATIAVIVIPAVFHCDAAKRAMEKGMNVIMEKPLSLNMEEANILLETKKNNPNVKFMASQNYRWRPHNQTIKKAIDDRLIGDVEDILVEFRKQEDLQGYRAGLDQPLLRDVCIHHFDLIRFFTGSNCKAIYARSFRPSWSEFEGRPNTDAVMLMENGVHVTYNGSWAARGKQSSWDGNFTITGSKGTITLDANDEVYLYEFDKNNGDVLASSVEKGQKLEKTQMEYTEMAYCLNTFIKCIENDIQPETTLEDNYKSFAMVCGGLESVETNQVVSL